jgi:hypothetical protein
MKALTIKSDGTKTTVEVDKIDLAFLQGCVGGYVEAIRLWDFDAVMYLNEDGLLRNLPSNPLATELAQGNNVLMDEGGIVGDVVITGLIDDEGYELGLTDDQIASLTLDLPL